jgi:hypothetical protein
MLQYDTTGEGVPSFSVRFGARLLGLDQSDSPQIMA